jgi:hypothetical protein
MERTVPLSAWEKFSTNIKNPVARARGSAGEVVVVDYFFVPDLLIGPTGPNLGEKEIKGRLKSCSERIRRRAASKYDRGEFTHVDCNGGKFVRIELTDADARWVLARVPDDERDGTC